VRQSFAYCARAFAWEYERACGPEALGFEDCIIPIRFKLIKLKRQENTTQIDHYWGKPQQDGLPLRSL
jgi:hypothetical protein